MPDRCVITCQSLRLSKRDRQAGTFAIHYSQKDYEGLLAKQARSSFPPLRVVTQLGLLQDSPGCSALPYNGVVVQLMS